MEYMTKDQVVKSFHADDPTGHILLSKIHYLWDEQVRLKKKIKKLRRKVKRLERKSKKGK